MNQRRVRRTVPNDHISKLGTTALLAISHAVIATPQNRITQVIFSPMNEPRHLTPAFFVDPQGHKCSGWIESGLT